MAALFPPARLVEPTAPRGERAEERLSIVYLDDDCIIIDKPANLLSVPGRTVDEPHVAAVLAQRSELGDNRDVRVVHRLDRQASGLLVCARHLAAQQHLVRQFEHREVEKTYYALVSGYVSADGVVDLPLMVDERKHITKVSQKHGKPSTTHYRIIQRVAGSTLVECRPVTGRMHQIRVHMASIGHPLTVDPLYGGGQAVFLSHVKPDYRPSRKGEERPLIARLTLHALRIRLTHPRTLAPLELEAPLPKDLRATIAQLARALH